MSQSPENLVEQVKKTAKNLDQPPLDKWHPELSGDMDLRISRDGQWVHKGKPLGREAIVKLFSTILRREDDEQYYLVTPVEKWRAANLKANHQCGRNPGDWQGASAGS